MLNVGDPQATFAARVQETLGELYFAARMPIIALRRTGEIVAANPAAVAKYGDSEAEFTSMRIHDVVADERNVNAEIGRAFQKDPLELTRRPHRRKDGSIIYVLPSAFPSSLVDDDGEPILVSFLQDVTSLDVAEERERGRAPKPPSSRHGRRRSGPSSWRPTGSPPSGASSQASPTR